jgi:amino acid adenylation domain-containing protein
LAELFSQKVHQNPDQLALKFGEKSLSYRSLDERSNQVARFLRKEGIGKGDRVVLFLDRSEEFLILVLSVIKAGAVYVPLDPAYPLERLQYMLSDSQARLILSSTRYKDTLQTSLSGNVGNIEAAYYFEECLPQWKTLDGSDPKYYESFDAGDLIYIMYTSGSTGQPKGVCINHRAIIRLVCNTWYLTLGSRDRIGHISNVCFDAASYEIWGALLNGATLIGFEKETILSEELFAKKLKEESVSNMFMTAALFHIYSRQRPDMFNNMRHLLVGGEAIRPDIARAMVQHAPQLRLMNGYGPTENAVFTAAFDIVNISDKAKSVPIGKPISNTQTYVVDKRDKEVPVGVVGELVAGGDGVGLGYWNKEDISRKSFVSNIFDKTKKDPMYRTGD